MREELLHFTWKNNYFIYNSLVTTDGDPIEVIDPGIHNTDSGPDFFNAKVKIGKTLWAGNIEIHINSSDWYSHGHHLDPAFDNTILHVVAKNDGSCLSSKGRKIPLIEIKYPETLEWNLLNLYRSGKWIPCEYQIKEFDPFELSMWMSNLMVERLEQKTKQVNHLVDQTRGDWEEAFYISLARSFGLKSNALPFELLAKSIPHKVLGQHKNNLEQIEALLFGQSGLLESIEEKDNYVYSLATEYKYLRHLHNLDHIDGSLWKFMRMRPVAFPTIRIAQFAMLIHRSSSLFSKIVEAEDVHEIIELFKVNTSEYWKNHYTFGQESRKTAKPLGDNTISIITINSVVPFLFAYGVYNGNEKLKEKSLKLIDTIKPEDNGIVKKFAKLGFHITNATDSQAVIFLKNEYCNTKKCLYCRVGSKLISSDNMFAQG